MKIIYISKLDGEDWQGPTYSVPKQVKAQSKYDEVYWLNINGVEREEWKRTGLLSVTKSNLKTGLDYLTEKFGKPDLVVFEGVYEYPFMRLIYDIWKQGIPYVIVPRSALSIEGQKRKRIKKVIGNFLFFGRFVKKASAIHYLTLAEKETSIAFGNTNAMIIPNGIEMPETKINYENKNARNRLVYIGRLEMYQKGFDVLIEACSTIKEKLEKHCVEILLFGPNRENSVERINKLVVNHSLEHVISIHNSVFGEEKVEELLKANAFIMTSRFEGLPMGLIEALSYGVPCLITEGTNLTNEVVKADAGWVAKNTPESVREMLLNYMDQTDLLQTKSVNAVELARHYSWDSIALTSHKEYVERMQA